MTIDAYPCGVGLHAEDHPHPEFDLAPPVTSECKMIRYLVGLILIGIAPLAFGNEPEFAIDVMSVLSKAGCNAGSCHGNLHGKGGLKLSLRGQDAWSDYQALVHQSRGRRINVNSPEQSLILRKASGAIPHQGGIRFGTDSFEYRTLHRWLAGSAAAPTPDAPHVVGLEIHPREAIVADPADSIQIAAKAIFSDGSSRDVTQEACYELSNLSATVDISGRVTRAQFGETTLIVRYLQRQAPVAIAFIKPQQDFIWSNPRQENYIDGHVFSKLKRLRMNPSELCNDVVFVRRAFLDAVGRLPTAVEARSFVSDQRIDKRARLIDQLLGRPEFADLWALKWADVLRTEEKVLDPIGVERFHAWIRDGIAVAKPLDQFVQQLVTGTGSTFEQPAANYYRANRDPSTRGETTARLFLGTRLQCAKCHNHPFDRWTQQDYYQWSSLFSQISYDEGENKRKDKLDKNEFAGDQIVLVSEMDEVRNPTTGDVAAPKFLGDQQLSTEQCDDRLSALAGWLASSENELFAKSQANFVWYHLMGSGLVDPIDDFRITNPASNPPLLEDLASGFSNSGFDLRYLVRVIMNSRTYQLSSEPNTTNNHDKVSYSHPVVRRLPAEVILDMQSDMLDTPATFVGFEAGIRAVQIPGVQRKRDRDEPPKLGDRFLETFGKPKRIMACECERSNETTLKQAFVLLGEGLNERLTDSASRLQRWADSSMSSADLVDELYWTALSRPPTAAEQAALVSALDASDEQQRVDVLQDIAWALMNAKEFLFRR